MGVKVATGCMHWSRSTIVPHSPPSSQTLASSVLSPSKKRTRNEGALVCRYAQRLDRSALFGTSSSSSTKLYRSRSCEIPQSGVQSLRRACSAGLDASSDDEFVEKIQELALKFQLDDDDDGGVDRRIAETEPELVAEDPMRKQGRNQSSGNGYGGFDEESMEINGNFRFAQSQRPFPRLTIDPLELPWPEIQQDPLDWPGGDEIIAASIERKANSVDLPLSLRIIKRKKQWQEGFRETGNSAYCSVKKAFSSMVFIIRELHSYTLHMRETLFFEDLQGILVRVQKEMHASFVWLFQQVFSHTPTLMVSVMILLANFTVHSMASHAAVAPPPLQEAYSATAESVSVMDTRRPQKFDSSAIRTFTISSSGEKVASVGGNSGGGGKIPPVASGTGGDGHFDSTEHCRTILPDGSSQVSSSGRDETVSGDVTREEELNLWNSMVDEASKMDTRLGGRALDGEVMQGLVSPLKAKIESDGYAAYFRTELLYQTALAQDPNNPLLLANFAQFLCLVAHDYDRAEEYFKRAVGVEPQDAEALSKYASFLWMVKKDLWAAEETYLEAISADPSNSFYAANYAHFLWSTGGEDTCFPLSPPDSEDTNFA